MGRTPFAPYPVAFRVTDPLLSRRGWPDGPGASRPPSLMK
jgi:hypothetical protein